MWCILLYFLLKANTGMPLHCFSIVDQKVFLAYLSGINGAVLNWLCVRQLFLKRNKKFAGNNAVFRAD